ncbi:MAG: hypothetical protein ABR975_09290 [Vulcanimicrobiaceae bacterium]|jgi:hypothetical protein
MKALFLRTAAALALIALPTAAFAQPLGFKGAHQVDGRIAWAQPYHFAFFDGVQIVEHDGTVINPTGATLSRGMPVRVLGFWRPDGRFEANEVDLR